MIITKKQQNAAFLLPYSNFSQKIRIMAHKLE